MASSNKISGIKASNRLFPNNLVRTSPQNVFVPPFVGLRLPLATVFVFGPAQTYLFLSTYSISGCSLSGLYVFIRLSIFGVLICALGGMVLVLTNHVEFVFHGLYKRAG